jgi:hypothetical protein
MTTEDLYDDEPEDDIDDEPEDEQPSHLRKQIEKQAKRAKQAEERALAAERKLAILASGLDLDNPQHAFFAEHYDGEMTAEAIKARATELGFLEPPKPEVPDAEVAQHAQGTAIAAGADTPAADTGIGSAQYEQEMLAASAKGRDAVLEVMAKYGSPFVEEII